MAHRCDEAGAGFRLEVGAWMITHCSYSVPFHGTNDDEAYRIRSLQQHTRFAGTGGRAHAELAESQAFYRLLTEDAGDGALADGQLVSIYAPARRISACAAFRPLRWSGARY